MKNYSKYLNPYMEAIMNNEVEHCIEQELMIENIIIPVLEREDVVFLEDKVEDGLKLQKYFSYKLIEWEIFLFACIVGIWFSDLSDIYFSEIRAYLGRGSGKNGFISFLCFYFISPNHGITGYNVDLLANSEDQSKVSFMDVYNVIKAPEKENERALKSNFIATKENIVGRKTKSTLRYNTSSAKSKDSKRTGCVIFDEKHKYELRDLENINALTSGLGKVQCPRTITISTNGHIRGGVLDKEMEVSRSILEKYNPDNRTLVFWCRIEKQEEWDKPDKWVKAIPSLRHKEENINFKTLFRRIKDEVNDMPNKMDYYPEFMAKRMNFPIGNKDVEIATWEDILATNQVIPDLSQLPCVGGIDFASTNDFVGVCLLFKIDEKVYVKSHTFICSKSRDLLGIKAPLREWGQKGDVEFIDDVEISPELVASWFEKQRDEFGLNILKIAIDFYRRSLMANALGKIGFDAFNEKNLVLIRPSNIMQIIPVMNSLFINHNLVYGDVPVLRWMTNNVKKINTGNNIIYGKQEPHYRKTDTFMAIAAAVTQLEELEDTDAPITFIPPIIY